MTLDCIEGRSSDLRNIFANLYSSLWRCIKQQWNLFDFDLFMSFWCMFNDFLDCNGVPVLTGSFRCFTFIIRVDGTTYDVIIYIRWILKNHSKKDNSFVNNVIVLSDLQCITWRARTFIIWFKNSKKKVRIPTTALPLMACSDYSSCYLIFIFSSQQNYRAF